MACITCQHNDPHDAAGLGVCRAAYCGCDGPVTEEGKARIEQMWRENIAATNDMVTVSRSDLLLVLRDWGSDDVSGESMKAYCRLSEVIN